MPTKYRVQLAPEQRQRLEDLVSKGLAHARTIRHAHMLLLCDESPRGSAWSDQKVADALTCGIASVARIRRRFIEEGLEACLRVIKDRPGRPPKIDGAAEAHLIALACSEPPHGRERWSLRLLTHEFVRLGLEQSFLDKPVTYETVRRTLKKTNSSLTKRSSG